MPNSSSPPPSPSKERRLEGPKPNQAPPDVSEPHHMPYKQKKTRDLPNLSDCHGCGRRIDYSNPKQRLQPVDSFWRIVLLCKKCRKQVNSGQLCPYCFKDTSKSVSDCLSCGNCHHLVHKNCIVKYENSAPWSYCSNKVGLEFSVCIDCWVPELLKRSIGGRKERGNEKGVATSVPNNLRCKSSGKGNGSGRSLIEVAKEAKCVVEKKVAVVAKAKETALRKAVTARNAAELASNALDLVAKRCHKGKEKEGLVGSSGNGSSGSDLTRAVDDAELAFQLHHAMNSSPRILKRISPMKFSSSDLLKKSGSFGEDRKIGGCGSTIKNWTQGGNISVEPACVETHGSCTFTDSDGLKPELVTYKRNNWKRKELQQSGIEASRGYTSTDSCRLKTEVVTYKRNGRKRKEHQPSVTEANGSCICIDSGGVKAELVTYKRNNVKRKECHQSGVDANGSCRSIEFSGLKPEIFTYEQNDGKRKEHQQSIVEANEGCPHFDAAVLKPELVTYKRNNGKRKECQQFGVEASESCSCTDPGGLNPEVVAYKRRNRKRKECEHCGEVGDLGNANGSVEEDTRAEHCSLVRESQSFQQDESKGGLYGNDGRTSTPEGCITDVGAEDRNSISISESCLLIECKRLTDGDVFTEDRSGNTYSDRYSFKYSRRMAASGSILQDSSSN